jgi:hypothetical protein
MRRRKRATISELRQAVECLPRTTRIAMLEGIRANEIIAGAYTDGRGICPMLAAHRAGGRTSLISFANAWDRFAFRGVRTGRVRRATERELLVLKTHLEASLLEADGPTAELAQAMAEHRALLAQPGRNREESRARPGAAGRSGDRDRTSELRRRDGWAGLRVFRRYDDCERAVEHLVGERNRGKGRETLPGLGEVPTAARRAVGRRSPGSRSSARG